MKDKPDFEKMAPDDMDITDHDGYLGYVAGCEKIWNDYVVPMNTKQFLALVEWQKKMAELQSDLDHNVNRALEIAAERDRLKSELDKATKILIAINKDGYMPIIEDFLKDKR